MRYKNWAEILELQFRVMTHMISKSNEVIDNRKIWSINFLAVQLCINFMLVQVVKLLVVERFSHQSHSDEMLLLSCTRNANSHGKHMKTSFFALHAARSQG